MNGSNLGLVGEREPLESRVVGIVESVASSENAPQVRLRSRCRIRLIGELLVENRLPEENPIGIRVHFVRRYDTSARLLTCGRIAQIQKEQAEGRQSEGAWLDDLISADLKSREH
jgi:hypothetical protein